MDGYADVDGAFDEDAESGRLQITVSTGEELILMPAPGAFQVGGRRDATKVSRELPISLFFSAHGIRLYMMFTGQPGCY